MSQIALFDTNAGFLQWVGRAQTHEQAILTCVNDQGGNANVDLAFLVMDVTDDQAARLEYWSEHGSRSSDYPDDLPNGVTYDNDDVRAILDKVRP